MLLEDLQSLINDAYSADGDFNTLADIFEEDDNFALIKNQYNPLFHNVHNQVSRPDKQIQKPTGQTDINGNSITATYIQPVNRISLPLQKLIVKRAAAFLCGNPIKIDCNTVSVSDKNVFDLITKIWQDNKLDYQSKQICKLLFSECQVAELWYAQQLDAGDSYWQGTSLENIVRQNDTGNPAPGSAPFKYRMRVLAQSLGDNLLPLYDNTGDMIAFGRKYITTGEQGDVTHLDIYTDDSIYAGTTSGAQQGWNFDAPVAHGFEKIPVIYYAQDTPDWFDVQPAIDRLETLLSNFADTVDYNGSPILLGIGEIEGLSTKGEQGKTFQLDKDADMKYLTWDQAPAAIQLEIDTLLKFILSLTDTPLLSFDDVKGLGNFSGVALELLFMGAHMNASDKEEIVGAGIQRRLNLLKQFTFILNPVLKASQQLVLKPKFTYYLPPDSSTIITNLNASVAGKILSQKTAVNANPYVIDAEAELTQIKEEQAANDAISPIKSFSKVDS